ncbi:hypothetical protein HanIR_Chr15g0760961 [Helianthus annuus]|nr:hypothetical protein HanIR_Chr15g0760961 [Helianthus annuus]
MVGRVVVLCMYGCWFDPGSNPWFTIYFFLFSNFNTIFQIITLGPFKFNFQSHTFFWGKGHKILLRLRPLKWLSRPCSLNIV